MSDSLFDGCVFCDGEETPEGWVLYGRLFRWDEEPGVGKAEAGNFDHARTTGSFFRGEW